MLKKISFLTFGLLTGFGILSLSFGTRPNDFEVKKNLEIFAAIFRELNALYADQIDVKKLTETAIDAMLNSLDPYTTYIDEENMEVYRIQTTGKYGGIGALIRTSGDWVLIAEPYDGSPAQRNGIMAGDKLLQIDGKSAKNKNTDDVSKMLKGQPGTEVRILLERVGESKPIEKIIKREEIKINPVPYFGMVNSKTGYIRLNSFTEDCGSVIANALSELKSKNGAQSLILDLRDNPGGLLDEAIKTANIFIPKGQEVVSTKGKERGADRSYKAPDEPSDNGIPLVVLIDSGSASASEIVSGVIQDLDRGIVIGERSYGKGLVQSTKTLSYNGKLKVTTAKYYLPSGRCIQAIDYSEGANREDHKKMADSLHTPFKTKGGRTVYDTGGIKPDHEIEKPYLANVTVALANKQYAFDYATVYRSKHPSINTPDKFELSDAEYDEFVRFLTGKDYEYVTESEHYLKELKKKAEKEQYADALKAEIADLENQLKSDKSKDLYKFKNEIKTMLEIEIVSRYYYQRGQVQESLEDDPDIKKSIEILNNPASYKQALEKK